MVVQGSTLGHWAEDWGRTGPRCFPSEKFWKDRAQVQRQWQDWGGSGGQGARKLSSISQLSHRSAAAGAEGDGSRGALLRNDSSFMGGGMRAERQQQWVRLRPAGRTDLPGALEASVPLVNGDRVWVIFINGVE